MRVKLHRTALRTMARDLVADPPTALCSAPALLHSRLGCWRLPGRQHRPARRFAFALTLLYLSMQCSSATRVPIRQDHGGARSPLRQRSTGWLGLGPRPRGKDRWPAS